MTRSNSVVAGNTSKELFASVAGAVSQAHMTRAAPNPITIDLFISFMILNELELLHISFYFYIKA
jgi:hypothetical protein